MLSFFHGYSPYLILIIYAYECLGGFGVSISAFGKMGGMVNGEFV